LPPLSSFKKYVCSIAHHLFYQHRNTTIFFYTSAQIVFLLHLFELGNHTGNKDTLPLAATSSWGKSYTPLYDSKKFALPLLLFKPARTMLTLALQLPHSGHLSCNVVLLLYYSSLFPSPDDHQVVFVCITLFCHRLMITNVSRNKIIPTNAFMVQLLCYFNCASTPTLRRYFSNSYFHKQSYSTGAV
jgi:hypothetical protein